MSEQTPKDDISGIPIAGEAAPEKQPDLHPEPDRERRTGRRPGRRKGKKARRRSGRWLRWLGTPLVLLVGGYLAFGYLLVPRLLTTLAAERLAKRLDRPVTIAAADFDPLDLTLTLKNVIVGPNRANPDDTVDPLFSLQRLSIDLEAMGLLRGALICRRVEIDQPFLHLVRDRQGHYNLLQALHVFRSNGWLPGFALNNLQVRQGRIQFDDLPSGKHHLIERIDLALPALANISYASSQHIKPRISATINGSPLELTGETVMSGDRLEARLALQLARIDLPSYLAYLPGAPAASVSKGTADLNGQLVFTSSPGQKNRLQFTGVLDLHDLWLQDAAKNTSRIKSCRLEGDILPLAGRYLFRAITIQDADLLVDHAPAGAWSLAGLLPWQGGKTLFQVKLLRLASSRLRLVDRSVPGGFATVVTNLQASLKDYRSGASQPASLAMSGILKEGGNLSLQAELVPATVAIKGLLVAGRLDLRRFAPLLHQRLAPLHLQGVLAKLESRFRFQPATQGSRVFRLEKLSARVDKLRLNKEETPWLQIASLTLQDGVVDWNKRRFDLGRIAAVSPSLLVTRDHNGRFNWREPATLLPDGWRVTLTAGRLEQGTLVFAQPANGRTSRFTIDQISGQAKPQAPDAPLRLILEGRVAGSGRLKLQGTMQTAPFQAALAGTLKGLAATGIPRSWYPWFRPAVRQGQLNLQGNLSLPDVRFTGQGELVDFQAGEASDSRLTARSIQATGISFTLKPAGTRIKTLTLRQALLPLRLDTDAASNLSRLFHLPAGQGRGAATLAIEKIRFLENTLRFRDLRPGKPAFSANLLVNGSLQGLASEAGNRARLTLRSQGPGEARGELNVELGLFDRPFFCRGTLNLDRLSLPALAPYLTPLLGYQPAAGRLTMAADFQCLRQQFTAQLATTVTGLRLGARQGGDRHLPLVVALLSDRKDQFPLTLLVRGRCDALSSSLARGISKTVNTLLAKAATAPFSLVRQAQAGLSDRIPFPPGVAEPDAAALKQLSVIAELLANRPRLGLNLWGIADQGCDRAALAASKQRERAAQRRQSQARLLQALSKGYGREEITPPEVAGIEVEPLPTTPQVSDQELRRLAAKRLQAVLAILGDRYHLPPGRLASDQPELLPAPAGGRDRCLAGVRLRPQPRTLVAKP